MRTASHTPRENPNVQNANIIERHRGFYIITDDCVITKNQIVTVMEQYQLVAFKEHGEIELRNIVFWHAAIDGKFLKLICYDLDNKVVIQKLHDLTRSKYENDWFLIEPDVFELRKELLMDISDLNIKKYNDRIMNTTVNFLPMGPCPWDGNATIGITDIERGAT